MPLDVNDKRSDNFNEDEQVLPSLFDMPDSGRITYEPDLAVYEMKVNDILVPREWRDSSLLRWILQTIYLGIPLSVGTYRSDDGKINEHAIFKVDPRKTQTIFVPLTELQLRVWI